MGHPFAFLKKIRKSKKQSFLYGCLIAIGAFVIIVAILFSIKVTIYETYTDKAYGIRIKYPTHWVKIDRPEGGAVVAFARGLENEMDLFNENVNITFHDLSKTPMTFNTFTRSTIRQLTMTFGEYVTVLQSTSATLAGRRAHKFIYQGKSDEKKEELQNPLKYMHVWVVDGQRAYIITYVGAESDFDNYLGTVNAMLRSFEIL